ncbi:putative methyltransferase nsun7 [Gaertneriomyces sp. JEL0708]|nr:putative methyltransferase nsun7 [Gaertneriomyces sp. JEL0708]
MRKTFSANRLHSRKARGKHAEPELPKQQSQSLRAYHSDISLAPGGNAVSNLRGAGGSATKSDAPGSTEDLRRSSSLLNDIYDPEPHTSAELIGAAEVLEALVNEQSVMGHSLRRSSRNLREKSLSSGSGTSQEGVMKLVYGTMKYLPYIDTLLLKTQFLVYHTEFLNHLSLAKVLFYDLMKYHFNFHQYPGIIYSDAEEKSLSEEILKALDMAVRGFGVKLSAAYARIRIQQRAQGETPKDMMEHVLSEGDREKEYMAVEMPKCIRTTLPRQQVMTELSQIPSTLPTPNIIPDPTFSDLLVTTPIRLNEIKHHDYFATGQLILCDKPSFLIPRLIEELHAEEAEDLGAKDAVDRKVPKRILCTRASTGMHLATLPNVEKVWIVEGREGKLEALKQKIHALGLRKVEIVDRPFGSVASDDPGMDSVDTIILEPPTTLSSIVDKMFWLQTEEEFPPEQPSPKDLLALHKVQVELLLHSLTFNSVQRIVYQTRSVMKEENEDVVDEALSAVNKKLEMINNPGNSPEGVPGVRPPGSWALHTVLPFIPISLSQPYEREENIKLAPSQTSNGIFLSCLTFVPTPPRPVTPPPVDPLAVVTEEVIEQPRRRRRRVKKEGDVGKKPGGGRLAKALRDSVNRLAIPKGVSASQPTLISDRRKSKKCKPGESTDDERDVAPETESDSEIPETQTKNGITSEEPDDGPTNLSVYGLNPKRFYAPREQAYTALRNHVGFTRSLMDLASGRSNSVMRWTYPVPNPTPWK